MKTNKALKQYEQYLTEQELAEGTKEIYLREAKRLLEHLSDAQPSKGCLLTYKKQLEAKSYEISTQNLYIIAINRYLKYIGRADCTLKANRVQKGRSVAQVLTMEEYHKLLACAMERGSEKYYMIMKTLAATGIRIGELKYFTVEALDGQVIQVTNKKKTREVCLPNGLTVELRRYCCREKIERGVIFRGKSEKAIDRTTVYKMLVRIADMAGVPRAKVHPHSFRHLFARTYMGKYSNLFELADLLGHSSLETTRIYARGTVMERRQRLDALGL